MATNRREEALVKAQAEIDDFRANHPEEDWGLDSDYVRRQQYEKTHERIETVQGLRSWSLGESTRRSIG